MHFHPWRKKKMYSEQRVLSWSSVLHCTAAGDDSGALSSTQVTPVLVEWPYNLNIPLEDLRSSYHAGPLCNIIDNHRNHLTCKILLTGSFMLFFIWENSSPIQRHWTSGVAWPLWTENEQWAVRVQHCHPVVEVKTTSNYWKSRRQKTFFSRCLNLF